LTTGGRTVYAGLVGRWLFSGHAVAMKILGVPSRAVGHP
jgi:hypothetical protein